LAQPTVGALGRGDEEDVQCGPGSPGEEVWGVEDAFELDRDLCRIVRTSVAQRF